MHHKIIDIFRTNIEEDNDSREYDTWRFIPNGKVESMFRSFKVNFFCIVVQIVKVIRHYSTDKPEIGGVSYCSIIYNWSFPHSQF